MPTTPTYAWPYPAGTDAADVPFSMQQLATAIETTVTATDFSGAWIAYTPTITGTTSPTVEARYKKVGKTVLYRVEIVFAGAATGAMTMTLPVAQRTILTGSGPSFGAVYAKDVSAGLYINGQAIWEPTTSVCRIMLAASGTNSNLAEIGPAAPFTWAVNDTISIRGEYEAA